MKPISLKLLTMASVVLGVACQQNPGDGGRASIMGHIEVEARVVMTSPATAQGEPYPARDKNVFLIYGDNVGPDDQVETNHEGNFIFPWLRPGEYTVYTYSEDTLGTIPPQDMVVLKNLTITSSTETVILDTLRVFKEL